LSRRFFLCTNRVHLFIGALTPSREHDIQNKEAFIQQLNISENLAAILVGMMNGIVIQANVDPKRINIKEVFDELILFMRSFVEKT